MSNTGTTGDAGFTQNRADAYRKRMRNMTPAAMKHEAERARKHIEHCAGLPALHIRRMCYLYCLISATALGAIGFIFARASNPESAGMGGLFFGAVAGLFIGLFIGLGMYSTDRDHMKLTLLTEELEKSK